MHAIHRTAHGDFHIWYMHTVLWVFRGCHGYMIDSLRCYVVLWHRDNKWCKGQQANKEDKDNKHWRDNKQHKVLSLQIKQWISTLEQEVCLAHTSLHCMMVDLTQRPITFAFTHG